MDDEVIYDFSEFDEEDIKDIVAWALNAAASIIVLGQSEHPVTVPEVVDTLNNHIQTNEALWESMPEDFQDIAIDYAQKVWDRSMEEEAQVERFVEQLKDL